MRIPPPVYLACALIAMWALQHYWPVARTTAGWPHYAGGALILAGISIDLTAAWQFRRHKTTVNPLSPQNTTAIVTDGLYRVSRNPMYAGMLLILCGAVFLFRALTPIVVLPLFWHIISRFQIRAEESILLEKFGDEFREYMHRVPRWF